MHPDWARNLRDFSEDNGIAFHFKQWGHWVPAEMVKEQEARAQFLKNATNKPVTMLALGKRDAGRLLDGRTYNGVPLAAA
jgi:protein gp37